MAREIKFRAWDRKAKAMFPVHKLEWHKISNDLTYLFGVDIHDKDSDWEGDVSYGGHAGKMTGQPLQPKFELMQYTGLKDKNGREIYEGDILQGQTEIAEVEWVQEHSAFMAYTKNPSSYHSLESDGTLIYVEVIGNIYENPDLLQES